MPSVTPSINLLKDISLLQEGQYQGAQAAPGQGLGGNAVTQGADDIHMVISAEETAVVQHAQDGDDDQGHDGNDHIADLSVGHILLHRFFLGVVQFPGQQLLLSHGAEIPVPDTEVYHHADGQQGVQIIGDGGTESRKITGEGTGAS